MNFFSRCRFKQICRKAEANTQLLSVQPTRQLCKMGKTPIKLDRIIYFTQNYPTFLFFSGRDLCTVSNYTICPRLPPFFKTFIKLIQIVFRKFQRDFHWTELQALFLHSPFSKLQVSPLGHVPIRKWRYLSDSPFILSRI